jgi:hypothetical protein
MPAQDGEERWARAAAVRAAASGLYSWTEVARRTLALCQRLL